ncbi:MAG: response regulator [Campylobacterota bacterium]|nr:response regulator [Campylobacterota bacterium]
MYENKIANIKSVSQKLRLLYVEDNETVRLTNIELLKNFFDTIDSACDGQEGLEKFQNAHYDIIITDINMPHMNGIEMIHEIRKFDREVAILIVSAYSDVEYFTSSIKVGIQGYVIKPTSMDQLIDTLEIVINTIEETHSKQAYQKSLEHQVNSESKKREETEALLIQQSKLASMGEMIGNIAHQWRQPLNELSLLIQSFRSAYEREVLTKDFIDNRINKGMLLIDKMSTTIDNFRNFYSPSKSKKNFSVIESIEKSLAIFEGFFSNNDIQIYMEQDRRGDYNFFGYSDEFEQVFVNLLSNAKDSIIEKNSLGDRVIYINVSDQNEVIIVEVYDNGLGLDDTIKEKIFQPYFTTKDDNKGTGIGLYMSKEIVDKHLNGSLEADNKSFSIDGIDDQVYYGAAFKVTLPHHKEMKDEL